MANPLKINDKGAALTCDEYDDNLDILQDRANHVGFQSCSTINDLDSCLSTSAVVTGIEDNITSNTDRIIQIESDLSSSGGIAQDLNNIEATLRADIIQNTDDINTLRDTIDLTLVPDIAANASQIQSLANSLTTITGFSNDRIADLELWRSTDEPKIDQSITDINTIRNTTIPAERLLRQQGDQANSNLITQEALNRQQAITDVTQLINNEVTDREQDVDTVDAKYKIITDALIRDLGDEIDDRKDGDTLLQEQINTLKTGLGGAIPTATILPFAGFNAPAGFLMCRGQAVDRTTYADLFSIISTRYGSTSTSTFNVPDMRQRTFYGSNSVNLNTVPTNIGQNTRVMLESEMPRHEHRVSLANHQHTVDYKHHHGLRINPHTHTSGNLPNHTHSLAPYMPVAMGGGSEDSAGAELTAFPADSPSTGRNTPVNSSGLTSTVPGPSISSTTISIAPSGSTVNRTDDAGGLVATSVSKSSDTDTSSRGGTGAFDVRQLALVVNYIIKT